jgi:hypothetical protein
VLARADDLDHVVARGGWAGPLLGTAGHRQVQRGSTQSPQLPALQQRPAPQVAPSVSRVQAWDSLRALPPQRPAEQL